MLRHKWNEFINKIFPQFSFLDRLKRPANGLRLNIPEILLPIVFPYISLSSYAGRLGYVENPLNFHHGEKVNNVSFPFTFLSPFSSWISVLKVAWRRWSVKELCGENENLNLLKRDSVVWMREEKLLSILQGQIPQWATISNLRVQQCSFSSDPAFCLSVSIHWNIFMCDLSYRN